MNKTERVRAALAGAGVDHVPASFWFHFSEKHRSRRPMAEMHLRYYEACDPDWLKVMNDTRYESPAGYVTGRAELDLETLATPIPLSSECFESFLEGLRILLDELAGEAPVIVTLFCPYATLNCMTLKQADALIRKEPEACLAALGGIAESLICFSRACIDAGAWGMYYSAQAGERERLTVEEHAGFVEAFDRQVLEAISDAPFNLLHVCGENVRMAPYWTYPAGCINWAVGPSWGNPTIAEGRERTDLPVAAGLDHRGPLATGPENALREAVRAALRAGGQEKYLLAAGCTVPDDVSWDLLRLARRTCIEESSA